MSAIIFVEGGGPGGLDARCKEGFGKLVRKIVPAMHNPRIVACGGRSAAYDRFCTQLSVPRSGGYDYVGLWVDSEDPVTQAPWAHLLTRDQWVAPAGATDDNVLFMTTCMETWCCADPATLQRHYGDLLSEAALPSLANIEAQPRRAVQTALETATRNCTNAYQKGKRSFALLAALDPGALARRCPTHFVRTRDLLLRYC